MAQFIAGMDSRVAVLVNCDNTTPEILEYALRTVAQFGRLVLRRGYGNHATLANKWQEALVRLAFTPCLQYQYAAGKNTSDIALAPDAMEALFDQRADTPDGRAHVGGLGSYLRRTDPAFSPQTYGHSGLVSMLKTYALLTLRQETGGHWTVALAAPKESPAAPSAA